MDAVLNFPYSTVATAPSPATSGTSLVVAAGHGVRFPAVPFQLSIWPAGGTPTPTTAEIVTVTLVSTDTLTIVRAQENTVARSVVVGDQVAATITAKTLNDLDGENAPALDMQILAAHSRVLVRQLTIASGHIYGLGLGAYLRVL